MSGLTKEKNMQTSNITTHESLSQARFNKMRRMRLPCHQLVYTSRPVVDVTVDVLSSIMESAQRHNLANHITGLLVFHQGRFMQLLEGDERQVHDLYHKIRQDPRHSDVEVVLETDSPRSMSKWTMGFSMSGKVDSLLSDQIYYISSEGVLENCKLFGGIVSQNFQKFLAA